jgi:hypothetical protein
MTNSHRYLRHLASMSLMISGCATWVRCCFLRHFAIFGTNSLD